MEVRRGRTADAQNLLVVVERSIHVSASPWYAAEQLRAWSSAFSESSIRHVLEKTLTFVVVVNDRIAGFSNLISSNGGRAEVDLLFVDPDFAGQGVARELIDAVERQAMSLNLHEIWVDASIPAACVFEHLGYEVVGTYQKEFRGLFFENTWLRRHLEFSARSEKSTTPSER